ncbi:PqqD family peptide modification chaperone [Kovacikia minuta CCNUW1]|uniref:PqqD family peptide modification chaperone n=1 Tax=Kovacikia minuta TaxID=2931930 RepID=UPI001CCB7361|nr:PqqD family peptide modification chaperone [Kovacikia minuta]UBF26556.1 PqqD family peptide modification chaperone [Kovacikia minuta CCNUW1]
MAKRELLKLSDAVFLEAQVAAVKEQVSSNLNGEAVILHIKTGSYYGLNEVASRIWSLIQVPVKVDFLKESILSEYDVEQQQFVCDLKGILNDLLDKGLVEISYEAIA